VRTTSNLNAKTLRAAEHAALEHAQLVGTPVVGQQGAPGGDETRSELLEDIHLTAVTPQGTRQTRERSVSLPDCRSVSVDELDSMTGRKSTRLDLDLSAFELSRRGSFTLESKRSLAKASREDSSSQSDFAERSRARRNVRFSLKPRLSQVMMRAKSAVKGFDGGRQES